MEKSDGARTECLADNTLEELHLVTPQRVSQMMEIFEFSIKKLLTSLHLEKAFVSQKDWMTNIISPTLWIWRVLVTATSLSTTCEISCLMIMRWIQVSQLRSQGSSFEINANFLTGCICFERYLYFRWLSSHVFLLCKVPINIRWSS